MAVPYTILHQIGRGVLDHKEKYQVHNIFIYILHILSNTLVFLILNL